MSISKHPVSDSHPSHASGKGERHHTLLHLLREGMTMALYLSVVMGALVVGFDEGRHHRRHVARL